ncbi:hypothetical protein CDG79_13585 [Nostoc sp. 'Peltigera membranacea cyanobiont' 232]|nr:hypothetical protein CDG79_13585 [Nostoc sp. 'Peltigera membranacea cyanobiont' 232]
MQGFQLKIAGLPYQQLLLFILIKTSGGLDFPLEHLALAWRLAEEKDLPRGSFVLSRAHG